MPNDKYPNLNIPLLHKTVEWTEEQEKREPMDQEREWDQKFWSKKWVSNDPLERTTYCFAGKIVRDAGWEPIVPPGGSANMVYHPETGKIASIRDAAIFELGLSHDPNAVEQLFHADNHAEDIRYYAEELAGEPL